MTTEPTTEERLKTTASDLSSLSRVSHRLAMIDSTDRLESVLDKLLPRLLQRIGDNHQSQMQCNSDDDNLKEALQKIHNKLIEMLSHILKRVRDDPNCQIPCQAILDLLLLDEDENAAAPPQANLSVDPFTMNLSLTFLTLGLSRYHAVQTLLPGLLVWTSALAGLSSLASTSKRSQGGQFAHLLLRCIERLIQQDNAMSTKNPVLQRQQQNETGPQKETTTMDSTPFLAMARTLCQDESVAPAIYDLLLDVLLYQTVSGNIPPNGLSQAGHERLREGQSQTAARDWAAEMALRQRLVTLKLALLDFIAPSRRYGLFLEMDKDSYKSLGLARTIALLVTASGDPANEVADKASSYSKMYMDSHRGKSTGQVEILGDPVSLACALLSLCLGQSHAESTLSNITNLDFQSLGRVEQPTGSESSQLIMSTKRRPVSESTLAALVPFVSKILEDDPQLLDDAPISAVQAIGNLSVQVATRSLGSLQSSSGLSTTRAKPYIAAAQLLNALVVRLTVFYDTQQQQDDSPVVVSLLAQSMSTVCDVLSGASQRSTAKTTTGSEGNIAIRDACYGVVCTLSRSQFALAPEGYIFVRGRPADTSSGSLTVSIETATLLFGCAANEEERLRPRAVAALDALLGAYCRVYMRRAPELSVDQPTEESAEVNPWMDTSTVSGSRDSAGPSESVAVDRDGLSRALLPLIWTAAQGYQPKASRVAAARWSSDLLKELELSNACHILCFLAGDSDVTASSIAREGLGPGKHPSDEIPKSSEAGLLPDFGEISERLFSMAADQTFGRLQRYVDFSFQGKAAALRFSLLCLLSDLYGGEDSAVEVYLSALTDTLNLFMKDGSGSALGRASIDLLDEASTCLLVTLTTSHFARMQITKPDATFGVRAMERLVFQADSSRARRHLAGACGKLYENEELWDINSESPSKLSDWIASSGANKVLDTCVAKLSGVDRNHFVLSQAHGAAFLGAHIVRALRLQAVRFGSGIDQETCWKQASEVITLLARGTMHSDENIGNACVDGHAIALSYDTLDAPVLDSRLYKACAFLLTQISAGLAKYGNGDHVDPPRVVKLAKAAGCCLAATTTGSGVVGPDISGERVDLGPARLACVDSVFNLLGSMSFRKDEEIALVAGEALASYADAFSPANATWSSSGQEWPTGYSQKFANELPPHEHVIYVLLRSNLFASSPHKRTASAPALLAVVARAARGVNTDEAYKQRSLVKSLLEHLGEVQNALITLLSDPKSKQLSRESCCLGLAACRGLTRANTEGPELQRKGCTSDELNQRLLRAFGQTTNFGGSAFMETPAQAAERRAAEHERRGEGPEVMEAFGIESEVGGASGIGEAALGAYREMASASVSLGRPSILYALLILSVSHSVWFTEGFRDRYSAAALLGDDTLVGSRTNLAEMRDALRPHLGKLIPRVLRACHDPNKQTREQMSVLWIGLTGSGAESRNAISQHLLTTIDSLIEDASSRLWRARVGACGALAEIIVGRDWNSLGGGPPVLNDDDLYGGSIVSAGVRLLRLWRVAVRALDDVRGHVRESGEKLARGLRALTIRLCDPSTLEKSSGVKRARDNRTKFVRDAASAAATSLRWLIRYGLNQPCAEATGVCVSTLVEIVGVVSPTILEPILPDLLRSLLMAMSGLEPAALNYLQLRTSDQDGLERARLQLAQTGPLATAVTKCLELLPRVGIETQRAVIPELDSALRLSAGFATRAATADAVSVLCNTCPTAFVFPGSSGSANPSVRLLRAFYFAMERERGQGAKDKMVHCLGGLAALCPGSSVRSLAMRACERYNTCTGNNDDPSSRRAAASALRAIAVRASNQFSDGGSSDIWRRRVLPVAFIGQKDPDKQISSLWKEVWEEGGSAAHLSETNELKSFGTKLEETLLMELTTECLKALKDVSWSRRVAGSSALVDLCNIGVLCPVPRSSQASKSTTSPMRARRRSQACSQALHACLELLIKPRLWTGKSSVLQATVALASVWVSAQLDDEVVDERALFGWDGRSGACPWQPLSMQFGTDDLFVGDKWFLNTKSGNEPSAEDEPSAENEPSVAKSTKMEVDDQETSARINFEECDKELGEEEVCSSPTMDIEEEGSSTVVFVGLCRLLINEALSTTIKQRLCSSDELLPYRSAAFRGFHDLIGSLPKNNVKERIEIYTEVSAKLISMFHPGLLDRSDEDKGPPVLVAAAMDCLSACVWDGFGKRDETMIENTDVLDLATQLRAAGGNLQPAWTVREAATLCNSQLVAKCHIDALRQHKLISSVIQCAAFALKDRKFWRVRYAGVSLLQSLINRSAKETDASSKQLILEALLPHKEDILRLLRPCLSDSESKITALSSDVLSNMGWWP